MTVKIDKKSKGQRRQQIFLLRRHGVGPICLSEFHHVCVSELLVLRLKFSARIPTDPYCDAAGSPGRRAAARVPSSAIGTGSLSREYPSQAAVAAAWLLSGCSDGGQAAAWLPLPPGCSQRPGPALSDYDDVTFLTRQARNNLKTVTKTWKISIDSRVTETRTMRSDGGAAGPCRPRACRNSTGRGIQSCWQ